jgi:DNA mismatch endonuclease, patch repair protein
MRAPSFTGLRPASASASSAKRANRSSDTVHERLLRRAIWRRGLRFRKNVAALPGKPDIVFTKALVAVFRDGDFWHGRNWKQLSQKLRRGANAAYWCQKVRANMLRDRRVTQLLEGSGWYVVRLWESDIKARPEHAALYVAKIVHESAKSQIFVLANSYRQSAGSKSPKISSRSIRDDGDSASSKERSDRKCTSLTPFGNGSRMAGIFLKS